MPTTDDINRLEMIALAPGRREAYAFLSSVFGKPPSTEGLAAIRGGAFLSSASALFSHQTLAILRQFAMDTEVADDLRRHAHQEYMNLFKVPGGQYVTPYESVFRDTREIAGEQVKGLLMGQSAIDVQKWYRLAALDICDDYKDLPDHIALELDYLCHLCGLEQDFAATAQDGKLVRAWEMQRDFLAAHVVSWIGMLRDKIHAKSRHAYFRAAADMAVEFTRRDLVTLEGIVGESELPTTPRYHSAAGEISNGGTIGAE